MADKQKPVALLLIAGTVAAALFGCSKAPDWHALQRTTVWRGGSPENTDVGVFESQRACEAARTERVVAMKPPDNVLIYESYACRRVATPVYVVK